MATPAPRAFSGMPRRSAASAGRHVGMTSRQLWIALCGSIRDAFYAGQVCLPYREGARGLRGAYTYSSFDTQVSSVADSMRQLFGLRRGDCIATVLFNHGQTVFIYFAAWVLGLGVAPISVEE